MTDFLIILGHFHFIRPWLLLLLPVAVLLWWRIRQIAMPADEHPSGIAPHLAEAMRVGGERRRRLKPVDTVTLAVMLLTIAAAGPAWTRVPNPLLAQTAPLTIVLEVSESMEKRDVAPSRLERAKHKIVEILELRAGARTALIAYAGSAHSVAPLSEDPAVLIPFLNGVSPEVMPSGGHNATLALDLAQSALKAEAVPGAVLFVADGIDHADMPALRWHVEDGGDPILVLLVNADASGSKDLSGIKGVTPISLTPDGADVKMVERRLETAYREALAADERQRWDDRGWVLAWPAALLVLLWFRRGWTMRWGLVVGAGLSVTQGLPARADGLVDWFFTPDQQGRLAFENRNYSEAADLFRVPSWRGYALYKAGRYEEAVEVFARIETPQAAFAEGMAHIKSRGYRQAVTAFETALERDPDYTSAKHNLAVAKDIVEYIERVREQSDTGEAAGIGADDIVYDNQSGRGQETQIQEPGDVLPQSAEQWMRTVDTRTADFLRSRFALEAARTQP